MFDIKTIATAAITAIVVVVVAGLVGGNQSSPLGATGTRFPSGLSTDSTSPSSGEVRTSTLTVTGASTLQSTLGVTGNFTVDTTTFFVDATGNDIGFGTTSPNTFVQFEEGVSVATSTVYFNSASTTATGAQLILEDTDGAGCTGVTALNGTVIAATVTCP